MLKSCGNLSHEETPAALLKLLSAFVARCLADAPPLSATPSSAALSAAPLSRTASGVSGRGGGVGADDAAPVKAAAVAARGAVGTQPELQYSGG